MSLKSLTLSKVEKLLLFKELAQDAEIKPDVQIWFDSMLATSELKPIKRIAELETVTGLSDYTDLKDEERDPTIPEQISALSEKVDRIESSTPLSTTPQEPKNIFSEIKTEVRAIFLVEYIEKEVKERNGELFLNGNEIKDFFTRIIPERYNPNMKVTPGQNIRKIKKDVIEKATKLFPGNISINKNKNVRLETRIIYRPAKSLLTVTS